MPYYVYRLEHNNGLGPFHSEFKAVLEPVMGDHVNELPTPWEEGLKFRVGKHVCGLKTRNQLLMWFGPFLELLEAQGFKVCLYRTDLIGKSEHQVTFEKESARLLGTYPPTRWAKHVCKETAA